MGKFSLPIRVTFIALLCGVFAAGCTKEAKKGRLLRSAERDFKAGAYDKAKIEYLNVLRLDQQNATAFARLGQIWFDEGVPLKAGGFLIKARELAPNDLENRLRLARAYNTIGKRDDARKEVIFVLEQAPANGEALLALTEMALTPEGIKVAEEALQEFSNKESVIYQLAAANVAMRKSDLPMAQSLIDRALALDPKSADAHHSKGILHLLQKDKKSAGEEFKMAAELSSPRSSLKISYADYAAKTGSPGEASAYLESLTSKTPDFLPAWTLRARIALSEKKYDETLALLENVFSRDPDGVDARLLQANSLLAKEQTKKAVDILEGLDRNHPGAPAIKFNLARAYLAEAKPDQANTALKQAIAADPKYTDAILLLAEINLRSGEAAAAITPLQELLKRQPDSYQAQILLADAYRAAGRLDDAAAIFLQQIEQSPKSPRAYTLLGLIQRQQGKTEEARRSFEKALELSPGQPSALNQLVELDLTASDFDGAMRRVENEMKANPNAASSYLLKGKVLTAKKEWPEAVAALRKTIELDSNLAPAYDLLVAIYLETGQLPQAAQELQAVLAKSPQNRAALMTLASIEEKQNDYAKARDTYDKLLAFDPNNSAALNNLAYIYAERLNQLGKAQELARKARSVAPESPAVADTLGWILFKGDDYQQSLPLLEEAAAKMADNPEVLFHLGMARYMMGQADAARVAFQQALKSPQDFPSKKEAERRLELLSQTASGANAPTAGELKTMVKEHPRDMVAWIRLAEVYKNENSFDRAAAAYDEALKLNPTLGPVALQLAELYAGPLHNREKALEFAKKARALAPSDLRVAGVLGRIAFDSGNFPWAYSLLQESSRQADSDPQVLRDFAWAAYSLGQVDQAQEAMKQSLAAAPDAEVASEAKAFLALTAAEQDPAALATARPEIEQALKKDPHYAPALMTAAALDIQAGATERAIAKYQDVLQRFPDFAPAQKQLALLYSENPARNAEAYDLAVKARKSLPSDPAVAQILGRLSYERKDYSRALQLLQESATKKPLDAPGLLYLGLSLREAKQPAAAMKALTEALDAGLPKQLSEVAQRTLGELKER